MLIVVEGADGCGKTSVAVELSKRLFGECIHFPDDNAVTGPIIRQYLKRCWSIQTHLRGDGPVYAETPKRQEALAFQSLMLTNRMEHMPHLIEAASAKTDAPVIVLARYWQSGVVYGQIDGLDGEWLGYIHSTMAKPHLNILLDIEPEESMRRRQVRDGKVEPERYESKLETTQKAIELYRKLWEEYGTPRGKHDGWGRWHTVDTTHKPLDQVIEHCYHEAAYRLRRLRGLV